MRRLGVRDRRQLEKISDDDDVAAREAAGGKERRWRGHAALVDDHEVKAFASQRRGGIGARQRGREDIGLLNHTGLHRGEGLLGGDLLMKRQLLTLKGGHPGSIIKGHIEPGKVPLLVLLYPVNE